MILYSYYRSSCSWRCRIVLEWKGLPYEYRPVNLVKGEQSSPEYTSTVHPGGLVPALQLEDGSVICQSVAIMEYLEESVEDDDQRRLLPKDKMLRAIVRMALQSIVSDCQPLQNLRVLRAIHPDNPAGQREWAARVIRDGLGQFWHHIEPFHGQYCIGDSVTLADVVLIPQLYNARRFGVDVEDEFGELVCIEQRLNLLHAFQRAAPEVQPDYPG